MEDLLRFTLPSMGIWLANPILSLIDTSVVGLCGSGADALLELAALTPATALANNTSHAMGFLAVATTGLVARAQARGAHADTQRAVADAVAVAAAAGVALALLLFLFASVPVLAAFNGPASASLVAPAAAYTRIRALGFPAALIMSVGQAACLASRDPGPLLRAVLLASVVNLVGDVVLCVGLGWGIAGAAAATAAAQAAAAAVLLRRLLRPAPGRPPLLAALPTRPPGGDALLRFARLGGPVAGVIIIKVAYFTAVTRAATMLSPTAAAAHGCVLVLAPCAQPEHSPLPRCVLRAKMTAA
jgi:Na+-driven multidrug efflux pump